ncbi:MAG: penicillin-binding protein, partial [Bacteroidetes bacterium QH_9_64_21]
RVARRWAGTFPSVVERMTQRTGAVSEDSADGGRSSTKTLPPERPEAMPDLTGLSTRRAVAWLHERGVDPRLDGQGEIVRQRPRAGAPFQTRVFLTAAQ